MKKKILYIDMDGVIANFEKALNIIHPGVWELPQNEERKLLVDRLCEENPDIFSTLEPIEGAIDAVNLLFNYFEVYFLSTAMWDVPDSFTHKRLWIEKYFGEAGKKRLILTHRKDLNIGHFLIDDRLKNGAENFMGDHIHFATEKFPDWDAVLFYLICRR